MSRIGRYDAFDKWEILCRYWANPASIMSMCSDTFVTNYFIGMIDQLGVTPDDLDGLSRAVGVRTGVDVEFVEMMERNNTVYWAVMRKPTSGRPLPSN